MPTRVHNHEQHVPCDDNCPVDYIDRCPDEHEHNLAAFYAALIDRRPWPDLLNRADDDPDRDDADDRCDDGTCDCSLRFSDDDRGARDNGFIFPDDDGIFGKRRHRQPADPDNVGAHLRDW